jgi:hypothetical protein
MANMKRIGRRETTLVLILVVVLSQGPIEGANCPGTKKNLVKIYVNQAGEIVPDENKKHNENSANNRQPLVFRNMTDQDVYLCLNVDPQAPLYLQYERMEPILPLKAGQKSDPYMPKNGVTGEYKYRIIPGSCSCDKACLGQEIVPRTVIIRIR